LTVSSSTLCFIREIALTQSSSECCEVLATCLCAVGPPSNVLMEIGDFLSELFLWTVFIRQLR
jgi:hypothetical protein